MHKTSEIRGNYKYWLQIPTRWQDGDPYGHVNNVVYYSWFDTAVTKMLLDHQVLRSPHFDAIGLCVESHCAFHSPVQFPEVVEAGVRIGRIGNTSLRYEIGLFLADRQPAVATGYFIHVFVNPSSRKPTAINAAIRAAILPLCAEPL